MEQRTLTDTRGTEHTYKPLKREKIKGKKSKITALCEKSCKRKSISLAVVLPMVVMIVAVLIIVPVTQNVDASPFSIRTDNSKTSEFTETASTKTPSSTEIDSTKPPFSTETGSTKPPTSTETGSTKPPTSTETGSTKPLPSTKTNTSSTEIDSTKPSSSTETGSIKPQTSTETGSTKPLPSTKTNTAKESTSTETDSSKWQRSTWTGASKPSSSSETVSVKETSIMGTTSFQPPSSAESISPKLKPSTETVSSKAKSATEASSSKTTNQQEPNSTTVPLVPQATAGSTYVRWGRTSCPGNGTSLLYSGYVGGSYFKHTGAAVNQLCLPKDPLWDHYRTDWKSGARLYGAEYEFQMDVSKSEEFLGQDLNDEFAVCSMCVSSRSMMVMIPARTACYDGWTKEYNGYLSASHHDYEAASEYLCMDRRPEFHKDGSKSSNGVLFYLVETVCGTLPCPPYEEGREIACVVCTK